MSLTLCDDCGGSGAYTVQVGVDKYGDAVVDSRQCEVCHGTGEVEDESYEEVGCIHDVVPCTHCCVGCRYDETGDDNANQD
jgi:DnaJ-class molecular chaperone